MCTEVDQSSPITLLESFGHRIFDMFENLTRNKMYIKLVVYAYALHKHWHQLHTQHCLNYIVFHFDIQRWCAFTVLSEGVRYVSIAHLISQDWREGVWKAFNHGADKSVPQANIAWSKRILSRSIMFYHLQYIYPINPNQISLQPSSLQMRDHLNTGLTDWELSFCMCTLSGRRLKRERIKRRQLRWRQVDIRFAELCFERSRLA